MSASEVRAGRSFVEVYVKDRIQEGMTAAAQTLREFGVTLAVAGAAGAAKFDSALATVSAVSATTAHELNRTSTDFVRVGAMAGSTKKQFNEASRGLLDVSRACDILRVQVQRVEAVFRNFSASIGKAIAAIKQMPAALFSVSGAINTLTKLSRFANDTGKTLMRLGLITRIAGGATSLGLRAIGTIAKATGSLTRIGMNIAARAIATVGRNSPLMQRLAGTFRSVGAAAGQFGGRMKSAMGKAGSEVSRVSKLIGGRLSQAGLALRALGTAGLTFATLAKSAQMAAKAIAAVAKAPGTVAKAIAKSPLTLTRAAVRTPKTAVKAVAAVATSAPIAGTAKATAKLASITAAATNSTAAAFARLPGRINGALNAAKGHMRSFGASVTSMGGKLAMAGAALAAVAIPVTLATNAFAKTGPELVKLADKTGTPVEQLSALQHAAERSEVSTDALAAGLKSLKAPDADALGKIGVDAEKLAGLPVAAKLGTIADSLTTFGTDAERAEAATNIFGERGAELLPLLDKGSQGITGMIEEAERLGVVMTGDQATAAKQTADAWSDITTSAKAAYKTLLTAIGAAVAPTLVEWADTIQSVLSGIQAVTRITVDWITQNRSLVVAAATVLGTVASVGTVLAGLGTVISAIVPVFGLAAGAVSLIFSPLGLLAAGVVAAGVAFVRWMGGIDAVVAKLKGLWGQISPVIDLVTKGITDALAAKDLSLAAEIAWDGVKVAISGAIDWISGKLSGLLPEWSATFTAMKNLLLAGDWSRAGELVWTSIQVAFLRGILGLRTGWAEFTTGLAMAWDFVVTAIRGAWDTAVNGIAKAIVWLWGKFDSLLAAIAKVDLTGVTQKLRDAISIDADATIETLRQDQSRADQQRQKALEDRDSGRAAELARTRAAMEKQIADLTAKRDELTNNANAAPPPDALAALKDAVERAKAARAALPEKPKVEAAKEEGKEVSRRAAKGPENVGSFSSAAVAFLAGNGGNAQVRTAKATEEMVKEQKATRRAITTIVAPTFAP